MSTLKDLFNNEAELDDEDDESFDEDTGDVKKSGKSKAQADAKDLDDSSDDEEDDDDEEAARAIREGFIVDEDEEEEEERRSRRKDRKRNRSEREQEEVLDDEDYDIIGEANPEFAIRSTSQPKLKRLKRGHRNADERERAPRLDEIFSDDEDVPQDFADRSSFRQDHRVLENEFDDFIEEDDLEDEDERLRQQEELEVARPRERGFTGSGIAQTSGLDQDTLDDLENIFGGQEYGWALALEEDETLQAGTHDQQLELKDVFEPSQLTERLLTDDDNAIRWADEPERFQIARKPYRHVTLDGEQFKEESQWISNLIFAEKGFKQDIKPHFQAAVLNVLQFFMVDAVEVPFVFQHRKDYLIHSTKILERPDPDNPDAPAYRVVADKLLNQNDLWHILDLDLKFRALVDKRNTLQKTYKNLKEAAGIEDEMFEIMLPAAATMEELQDLQDYIYFQYAAQIKDIATATTNIRRRPGGKMTLFERIRKGKVYNLVRAYGIEAGHLGQNFLREGKRQYIDDPSISPIDLADSLISSGEFSTGDRVLNAARQMFAEELVVNPRVRKYFRMNYYMSGLFSCRRTEKGLRRIDEHHQFYEVKYLKDTSIGDLVRKPDLFLKMLKAEEEGLIEIQLRLEQPQVFRKNAYAEFVSENFSENADAWNEERRKVLDIVFTRIEKLMVRGVKENFRSLCEDKLALACRDEYEKRLDQAPYKPKGMMLGTIPRVLAISNGMGGPGAAICWAWVEEDGRVLENGKFNNLSRDEKERDAFAELVERRKPDVIGVGGFSVETNRLIKDIRDLVIERQLRGAEYEDSHTDTIKSEPLEVLVVNDEVARLYKDSLRAALEHPTLPPIARYCVALAKYLQSPMKEYAALGDAVVSLQFHKNQQLLPADKLSRALETAMVDMVNLCGIDINEAVVEPYTANLLPYICGLGPRKATSFIKAINANGGIVNSRAELVGDPDSGKLPVCGPIVWTNCASFLHIEYDPSSANSDYLDSTRVHPEDYELGRKMAADALELDEEDVNAEVEENGPGAVIRKLVKDEDQDKVNDLVLEEYAEQLENNHHQRKRATLETIRAELQAPYEELRRNLMMLTDAQVFTMFTGETPDESLYEGMIVSVNLRVVKDDFIIAKLDSGIDGRVEQGEATDNHDVPITRIFQVDKTYPAKVLALDIRTFSAALALRETAVSKPASRFQNRSPQQWDVNQEILDKEELKEKDKATGRVQRVIKHPLFRAFNGAQAEEYLGSQATGDAVIRLSSKGDDHLAVTWKVADGVYQHIDVLELEKENEYSVGKNLRIWGKYNYCDLDELIVEHVKAMSRKVDEMMQHEKFQSGTQKEVENWLTTYTEANPKRSVYAFCIDTKRPGYFFLCFKAGLQAKVRSWPVRVIPQAYELMNSPYGDMRALCNGFKLRHQNELQKHRNGR